MKQVAPMLLFATLSVHAQKSPQDMNRFIDNLMKKMTLEEKIGQLNLPVTGEITTGQAKSSDISARIKRGEREPSGDTSTVWYGCDSWL